MYLLYLKVEEKTKRKIINNVIDEDEEERFLHS